MSESIPTTESIKALTVWASVQDLLDDERTAPKMAEARRRFDAWIEAVERAAAEKALTDAADQWRYHWGTNGADIEQWLRKRAAAYR